MFDISFLSGFLILGMAAIAGLQLTLVAAIAEHL